MRISCTIVEDGGCKLVHLSYAQTVHVSGCHPRGNDESDRVFGMKISALASWLTSVAR